MDFSGRLIGYQQQRVLLPDDMELSAQQARKLIFATYKSACEDELVKRTHRDLFKATQQPYSHTNPGIF